MTINADFADIFILGPVYRGGIDDLASMLDLTAK
jgi:hypothetical protein